LKAILQKLHPPIPGSYVFDNKMLVALIIPLIIEQVLSVFLGLVDTIMIAGVGEEAISAVVLVDSVMILMIGLFGALATGGAVIAGQYMGQKNMKAAIKATNQMVWSNTIVAVIIATALLLGRAFLFHVVFRNLDPMVETYANTYLLIVGLTIPFLAINDSCAAIFRSMGNSRLPMLNSLFMNIVNVIGNAVFIFGLGWGVRGAALATLISRIVAAAVISIKLMDQNRPLHLTRSLKFIPDFKMIGRIFRIGVPNGVENAMFQMGKILVLSIVASMGTFAIAANGVAVAVVRFQLIPSSAIGLAMVAVISRAKGTGDNNQVHFYVKRLMGYAFVGLWAAVLLALLVIPLLVRVYGLSPETAALTKQLLYFHAITSIFFWPTSFILPSALRSCGDVMYTMVVSFSSMWITRVFLSFFLGLTLGLGALGVWMAMSIDWVVRSAFFFHRYRKGKWRTITSI